MGRKVISVVIVLVATFGLATSALAHPADDTGGSPGHSDKAAGAAVAAEKCMATWDLTPLAGETGSTMDNKQGGSLSSGGDTGVSNCDQWWSWAGHGSNNGG
jgi:hypothetical protein